MWPEQKIVVLLKRFREDTEIAFALPSFLQDPHKRMQGIQQYTAWPEGNEKQILLSKIRTMSLLPHRDNFQWIYREAQTYWCWTLSFFQACWKNTHLHTSHRLSTEKNFWTLFFLPVLHILDISSKGHQPFVAAPQELFHMQDIHIHKRASLTPSYFYNIPNNTRQSLTVFNSTPHGGSSFYPFHTVPGRAKRNANVMLSFQPVNSLFIPEKSLLQWQDIGRLPFFP